MTPEFTVETLTPIMERFGNYASLQLQKLCHELAPWVPRSVAHALGLRESGLRNICGGAKKVDGVWVPVKTDRGFLQITDTLAPNRAFLGSVLGCPDGSWVPRKGFTALAALHCPTLTAATRYVFGGEFTRNHAFGLANGVPEDEIVQFCVAAHNAGATGALVGFRAGNVDQNTTRGNYSGWVMANAPVVEEWLAARPNWQFQP